MDRLFAGQPAGGRRKKLIERDPVLDLCAFYAPRGITPEEIRRMSLIGRARWYEETRLLIACGIATAFPHEEQKEGAHGEE